MKGYAVIASPLSKLTTGHMNGQNNFKKYIVK